MENPPLGWLYQNKVTPRDIFFIKYNLCEVQRGREIYSPDKTLPEGKENQVASSHDTEVFTIFFNYFFAQINIPQHSLNFKSCILIYLKNLIIFLKINESKLLSAQFSKHNYLASSIHPKGSLQTPHWNKWSFAFNGPARLYSKHFSVHSLTLCSN